MQNEGPFYSIPNAVLWCSLYCHGNEAVAEANIYGASVPVCDTCLNILKENGAEERE